MASATVKDAVGLVRRWYDGDGDWHNHHYSSAWYDWGRWVLVGVIALIVVAAVLTSACVARRRHRQGMSPMYGTGWMYGGSSYDAGYGSKMEHGEMGPTGYNQNGYNQAGYAPPNGGYYGQPNGVQPPPNAYQANMAPMK